MENTYLQRVHASLKVVTQLICKLYIIVVEYVKLKVNCWCLPTTQEREQATGACNQGS
jgi:hypothetical protein